MILESYHSSSKGDLSAFQIPYIATKAKVTLLRGNKWDVPEYETLENISKKFADVDRANF